MPLETHVDSFELARSRRRFEGEIALARLARLAELLAATDSVLHYRIDGIVDDSGHPGADLHLKGRLRLTCQRCNAPIDFDLDRTTRFRFVASEEELNSLPIEDNEIDAIVGSHTMNLADWIEDEAILSLPLVPRHGECSAPLAAGSEPSAAATPNPFAALAALRNGPGGGEPRG